LPLLKCYLERRGELGRYFAARLRSDDAAQDLLQDLYIKVNQAKGARPDNPRAYLYRLGSNLMLDRLKERRRRLSREADWRRIQTACSTDEEVSDTPDPDTVLTARRRLRLFVETMNRQPAAVRVAFQLHRIYGLTHVETAREMGVSRSSVEKYLMTAIAALAVLAEEASRLG